ncbi:integrase [Pseudomonas fragi]|uniref:Integrase n=1 Tax=Pseudomonas fragi TaxID=296 RepID=A0A9Q5FRF0_PSEFR|nr:integrase [Pseudomonas fragi]NNB52401.1 integrase [Pseudomonas fragi]
MTVLHSAPATAPIKRKSDNNKIGKAAKELRDKRLPNLQAVMALADIFAQESEDPKDIFTSSVFALLLCAPSRISEVLALPVDCVHEEMDKEGVSRFGLRFYSGKNYGGNVKWVSTPMIPIARLAIKRLASITEQGRALAKWVSENPHSLYMHENSEGIDIHSPLTRFQTCAALNLNPQSFSEAGTKLFQYKFKNVDSVTYSELLSYAQKRMPQGFPWVSQRAGVRYDNALFSMTANMLHATRANVPFIPWMPTVNVVNNDLSPRESLGDDSSHKSIFDRFGYKHADGSSMKITTHQLRHLIDTMGQRGGLSEEEIARWAGRADPKQNRTYNHVTEIEQVERLEQYHLESAFNAGQDLSHHDPVTKREFELIPKGAVHTTIFGFCVHDFVLSPCGKARDCTNCEEHVCVKKDDERRKRVESLRDDAKAQVSAASEGVDEGLFGADRWLEHHELSLSRLNELVGILNDPHVPEGSLVKLKNENSFSHLRRALGRQKSVVTVKGNVDERAVTDDLLLLMGGKHVG